MTAMLLPERLKVCKIMEHTDLLYNQITSEMIMLSFRVQDHSEDKLNVKEKDSSNSLYILYTRSGNTGMN